MLEVRTINRNDPTIFPITSEASLGEKKAHDALLEWSKAVKDHILTQVSEALEVAKNQLEMVLDLDWSRVAPSVKERAEIAAGLKIPIGLSPEERTEGEFKILVRTKDQSREILTWEGSLPQISIIHPVPHDSILGSLLSDLGFTLTKRLNTWCAENIDSQQPGFLSRLTGSALTPVFTTVTSIPFAKSYWSVEELKAGYRFSHDFEITESPNGGKPFIMLGAPTHSALDPRFSPNLDKRHIGPHEKKLLVELLVPQALSTSSPDHMELFLDSVFKRSNRGRAPSDLRSEVRQLCLGATLEHSQPMSSEQLEKLGLKAPDVFKSESRAKVAGSEKAKIDATRALRSMAQAIDEDGTVSAATKGALRGLLTPIIGSIQHGQKVSAQCFDKLIAVAPAAYHDEINRFRNQFT